MGLNWAACIRRDAPSVLGSYLSRLLSIFILLLNSILKLLRDRDAFAALGLKVANVLDLPEHILEILRRV